MNDGPRDVPGHDSLSPIEPGPAAVHGHIDSVSATGSVRGWCAATQAPFGPRLISVLCDGVSVASGVTCAAFRRDLQTAGIGDGNHGFAAEIPAAHIEPGAATTVTVRDDATGTIVGQPVKVRWPERAAPAPVLEAHIDQATQDGMITGWCWDSAAPERHVALDVLADGSVAGTTVTGLYRDDLRTAGKGSGHCGFSFFLPWHLIAARAETIITLRDHDSGESVGPSVSLRRPVIVTAEQRMEVLERQIQLLRGELQAAEAAAQQADEARSANGLFRMVAGFFQDLADGRPRASLTSLRTRMDEIAERFPLIPLRAAEQPAVTIFVLPDRSFERLYGCLAALHRAGADSKARIVVLDRGQPDATDAEDVALIPAVARNAAALRLRPDETINDVLDSVTTPFLAILPSHLTISPGWLDNILAAFARDDRLALAGGALRLGEAMLTTRRLRADPTQGLQAMTEHGPAAPRDASPLLRADGVDELGIVARASAWREAGGLDLSYSSLAAQILDLCLRLRRAGLHIGSASSAVAQSMDSAVPLLDQCTAGDLQRLRAICATLQQAATQARPVARPTRRARA